MINNKNEIIPLLSFNEIGDFYQVYILKRKKDQSSDEKNQNQSVRTIKTYSIDSFEYLNERMPEIIELCETFKARAYIQINKRNHKQIALRMMERLVQRLKDNIHNQRNLFDSVASEKMGGEKRWIVDVDTHDICKIDEVVQAVNSCRPQNKIPNLIKKIWTKNGVHLITNKFDHKQFMSMGFNHEIQKYNPTMLYFPQSLNFEKEIA